MLTYRQEGKVGRLVVDDGKVNVISHAFCESVHAGLDQAARDADAVILQGRPGRFCAGFDLKELEKGLDEAQELLKAGAELILRLFTLPQPLVIACTGHAIAGGALIVLTGDTRVGTAGAFKIGLNETAIGMPLPVFGLELPQARLSRRHLQAAVIQARMYDPAGAVDAGYLDEVVDADALESRTREVAAQLAELPADAYVANKRGIRRDVIARLEAAMA